MSSWQPCRVRRVVEREAHLGAVVEHHVDLRAPPPRPSFSARGVSSATIRPAARKATRPHSSSASLHVVRRQEDRRAVLGERGDGVAQLAGGPRVQAAGRLVEEQHPRAVEQRAGQQQPLAHAGGERLDLAPGDAAQAHLLEHLVGTALRDPVERAEELEVLPRGRALVDVRRLRDEVDLRRGPLRARAGARGRAPARARSSAWRAR